MERFLFGVSLSFTLFLAPGASAQTPTPIACVSQDNLAKIARNFSQFQHFVGAKTEYCEADLGVEWLKIANSLVVLMNAQANEPTVNVDDALSLTAITEKDWWAYVTTRASLFSIEAKCGENIVAYVIPFLGDRTVHICKLFFDMSVYSQASTMMHEVRHFDGHSHVGCTQGLEKGVSGACDGKIIEQGSYAVSVQTLVGMARSQVTDPVEKPGLEAEAVYMAFNKFNVVPQVKLNNSIILSNSNSEVYSWDLGQDIKLLKQLAEPAIINESNNRFTIYPLNVNSDAYRKDLTLNSDIANPGLFAKQYNAETPAERAKYKSFSYIGLGGLLKGNSLFTLCGPDTVMKETILDGQGATFSSIISISADAHDQERNSLLIADNGEVHSFKCQDNATSDLVTIEKTTMTVATGGAKVISSFGLNGEQFVLLDNGALSTMALANNVFNLAALSLPIANKNWVSATPYSRAEVF